MRTLPVLYVDPSAWHGRQAVAWLEEAGVAFHQRDVREPAAREALGGADPEAVPPLLAWEGDTLSVLDRGDLMTFLRNHDVRLEDR